jgi:hypothetical protein
VAGHSGQRLDHLATGDVDAEQQPAQRRSCLGCSVRPSSALSWTTLTTPWRIASITGRAATCRAEQTLRGRAEPNRIIAILIGLVQVGTVTSDAAGNFSYNVTLPNGCHRVSARYAQPGVSAAQLEIVSPRDAASGQATGILVNDRLCLTTR